MQDLPSSFSLFGLESTKYEKGICFLAIGWNDQGTVLTASGSLEVKS
jgi:hypothetical protein